MVFGFKCVWTARPDSHRNGRCCSCLLSVRFRKGRWARGPGLMAPAWGARLYSSQVLFSFRFWNSLSAASIPTGGLKKHFLPGEKGEEPSPDAPGAERVDGLPVQKS